MSRAYQTISKNLTAAREHDDISKLIRSSQLEEIIHLMDESGGTSLRELFTACYDAPLISRDMLYLCKRLTKGKECSVSERKEKARIAALNNPLMMKALKSLTEDITTLLLTEESDFRSCCEAVSSESADYCVIPVFSSVDGYYPTFSKLTKAYDLKICKSVRILKSDNDEELEFALLSKEAEVPKNAKNAVFSFAEEDKKALPMLINAFFENNVDVISVQSTPLEFNVDRFEHRIQLSLDNLSCDALLLFLNTSLPGHTLLGIY